MYYDAKECGKRIKEQIKVMGYTQEAFAESVDYSQVNRHKFGNFL